MLSLYLFFGRRQILVNDKGECLPPFPLFCQETNSRPTRVFSLYFFLSKTDPSELQQYSCFLFVSLFVKTGPVTTDACVFRVFDFCQKRSLVNKKTLVFFLVSLLVENKNSCFLCTFVFRRQILVKDKTDPSERQKCAFPLYCCCRCHILDKTRVFYCGFADPI